MDFAWLRIQTRPTRCLWFLRPLIPRSHLAPFFLLPLICRRPRHCRAYPTYNLACSISTLWYLTCYVKYLQFLRQNHKSRYIRSDKAFTRVSSPFSIDNIFINFTLVFLKKVSKLCTCVRACVRTHKGGHLRRVRMELWREGVPQVPLRPPVGPGSAKGLWPQNQLSPHCDIKVQVTPEFWIWTWSSRRLRSWISQGKTFRTRFIYLTSRWFDL